MAFPLLLETSKYHADMGYILYILLDQAFACTEITELETNDSLLAENW